MENIYLSLDEAREKLRERWNDVELKSKIENELGDKFIQQYSSGPLGITTRQIISADNGCSFLDYAAHYIGAKPCAQEFYGDKFVHFNEEKKGLGRLRITLNTGEYATIDCMDFHACEKKKLIDCQLKSGESLVEFHHELLAIDNIGIEYFDNTNWYHSIGHATDYYYYMLLHFVAHGVLFETFYDEGGTTEDEFTHNVVYPTINRIHEKFGLMPMLIRAYPEHQSDEEDFYWWNHSNNVNKCIIEYALKNNLEIKKVYV